MMIFEIVVDNGFEYGFGLFIYLNGMVLMWCDFYYINMSMMSNLNGSWNVLVFVGGLCICI